MHNDPTAWRPRHALAILVLDTLADGRAHQQAEIARALGRTAGDGTTRRLLGDLADDGAVERSEGGWRLPGARRDRARAAALTRVCADAERVRRLAGDLEWARDDLAGSVALAREVGVPAPLLAAECGAPEAA